MEKETLSIENDDFVTGSKLNQYLATLAAAFGAFTVGTILSWSSSALPMLQNSTTTPFDEPITESEGMWVGSLVAIGALIGAFPAGYLADKIGRKNLQLTLSVPFIISWIIIILSKQIELLYFARLLAGVAVGGICVVAPLYIGEIAETSIRGGLGSYFQLLLTIGILFSYLIGALVNYVWLGGISCIAPVIFLIALFFMPETPFYLISKNKKNLAEKSLKWLRGNLVNVELELNKIEVEVTEAAQNKGTFKDLISKKSNVNALVISLGLMLFQQLCGINAVIFYAAEIFRIAGTDLDPFVCAIIVGVSQVVFTYGATLLVDRTGRKILLLLSSGVMIVCLFVLGIYFQLKENDESSVKSIGWLPLLSVNVFVICFSLGFGPLPWMMMGELFSTSIKEMASAMAVVMNWVLVFAVTKTFSDLLSALGKSGAFWLFGGISCIGFLFVCFVVKETKGKSFGDIQKMLGG
ncbi:sugar transporter, putative [Pediculus humanus corporis]|uniref:Sugar transporter, putative n=1 Tax=Pediculus humanus subsp. corporis TaxID=121224 RepID=E0W0B0_PEDHC|nr:sugar transporter, putative [Pediculus humanus corporis]EEB19066.1 sugar transporter, putative [Pediculus humanus corporis]